MKLVCMRPLAALIVAMTLTASAANAQGLSVPDTSDLAMQTIAVGAFGEPGWTVKFDGFDSGLLGFPAGQTKGYTRIFVNGPRSASVGLYAFPDNDAAVAALTATDSQYWEDVLGAAEPLDRYGDGGSYHLPLADFGQYVTADEYMLDFVRGSMLVTILLSGFNASNGPGFADRLATAQDALLEPPGATSSAGQPSTSSTTATPGSAAPAAPTATGGRTTRLCQPVGAATEMRWECGDTTGYIFNLQAKTVSLYTVPNPSRIVDGPIHIVSMGAVSGSWLDSSGRQCIYQLVDAYFQNKQINVTCGL
jgi:hypothetical protein